MVQLLAQGLGGIHGPFRLAIYYILFFLDKNILYGTDRLECDPTAHTGQTKDQTQPACI